MLRTLKIVPVLVLCRFCRTRTLLDRYGTTPAARVHLIRLSPDFGLETAAQDLRRLVVGDHDRRRSFLWEPFLVAALPSEVNLSKG